MCRIPIANIRSSLCKIHAKGVNVIGKLQGASVFIFSRSKLFSQVFLKDIGLRYRKFITQNRTFADQLFWNTSQSSRIRFTGISFLLRWLHFVSNVIFRDVYFPNYNCLLFFCSLLFTLIMFIMWRSHFKQHYCECCLTDLLFELYECLCATSYF